MSAEEETTELDNTENNQTVTNEINSCHDENPSNVNSSYNIKNDSKPNENNEINNSEDEELAGSPQTQTRIRQFSSDDDDLPVFQISNTYKVNENIHKNSNDKDENHRDDMIKEELSEPEATHTLETHHEHPHEPQLTQTMELHPDHHHGPKIVINKNHDDDSIVHSLQTTTPNTHQMTPSEDDDVQKLRDREEKRAQIELAQRLGDANLTPPVNTTIDEEREMEDPFDIDLNKKTVHDISPHNSFTISTALQNDPHYRVNPDRYCGLLRGYIRQDWHTVVVDNGLDELRAGWVELFFDLIFVACIVHLSAETAKSIVSSPHHRRLAEDTESNTVSTHCDDGQYDFLFTAFAQFGLLSSMWMEQVMYTTHFVVNQHIDEFLRVAYMTCVLSMGIFVSNDPAYHIGFFCSYALCRCISICMFIRVMLIPRAKYHGLYHVVLHSIIVIVLLSLIIIRFDGCSLDYFAIYVSLFSVEYMSGVLQFNISDWCHCKDTEKIAIPLNVPHIAERYGLFVMIILGEALIAIMTTDIGELDLYQKFEWDPDNEPPPDLMKVFFFLLVFLMSYCIGRLYYNCQPSEESILTGVENHALRINRNRARTYIHTHLVLNMALLGYGIGIKLAAKHVLEIQDYGVDILLPGYSLVVIVICLNVIRAAHPFDANKCIWSFRILIIIIMIIVLAFGTMIPYQGVIWAVMFLCILGLVATDVEGEQKVKTEKEHEREKRNAALHHELQKQKEEKSRKDFWAKMKHLRGMTSGIGLM